MHSLTTRARAEQDIRTRLLAGAPAPKPQPLPAEQARARRFLLYTLLAVAAWLLAGSFWPSPPHVLSLEPAPAATHSHQAWHESDYLAD